MSKAVTQEGELYRRIDPSAARALYETGTPVWLAMSGMDSDSMWLDCHYTNDAFSEPGSFDSIVRDYHDFNSEEGGEVEFYIYW